MMSLAEEIRPLFNISYHSYGELVLYPYGCPGTYPKNRNLVKTHSDTLASLLVKESGSGHYTSGTSWEILYGVDGDDKSWLHHEYKTISFTVEINKTFFPSFDHREWTIQNQRPGWMDLINSLSGSGVRGYLSSLMSNTMYENTSVHIQGLGGLVFEESYKVKNDGSFHAVLLPGMYKVSVSQDDLGVIEKEVIIGESRIDLYY